MCRAPSPVSVIIMPYLRRFTIITDRNGARAYDLKHTMDRLGHYRDNGAFRWDAASANIATIEAIRGGEMVAMDGVYWNTDMPSDRYAPMVAEAPRIFWFRHGVQVDMRFFDDETFEIEAVEATEAAERAYEEWNQNGDNDSVVVLGEDAENPIEIEDVSLDEMDAQDLDEDVEAAVEALVRLSDPPLEQIIADLHDQDATEDERARLARNLPQ